MSSTSLRPIARHAAQPLAGQGLVDRVGAEHALFGIALMQNGHIDALGLMAAMRQTHLPLVECLIRQRHMTEARVYQLLAAHWAVGQADFDQFPIDSSLLGRIDASKALAQHWVPWRRLGSHTLIVCAYPENFDKIRSETERIFGSVTLAIAPRRLIAAQILAKAGRTLARRAETRLPADQSCRDFTAARAIVPFAALTLAAMAVFWYAPIWGLSLLIGVAIVLAYSLTALKWAAAITSLWAERRRAGEARPAATGAPKVGAMQLISGDKDLPMMSIMVPLYRESRIVARLIRRLERLDYPRMALEILLLTEDNDDATAKALAGIDLPSWMRVLSVPSGTIRTKPRALNYGLDHCKGDIIGVYDAEDAPAEGQLRDVAQGFASAGDDLGCLQGRLDYYNPHRNWMSRCFTIEYATWWRVVLPGFAQMGFAIPLGGTTLFFKRDLLLRLGGWDAHNVTEDADLGLRLARAGYRTALLDSTTMEEANSHVLLWIKQRSRWIKGYIMTYISHMRRPLQLYRDLGPWAFFGMQMMFAGSVVQALLSPLLMILWMVPFGLVAPDSLGLAPWVFMALAALGVLTESVAILIGYAALRRTQHRLSPLWLPSMIVYNMLASIAAYKAVFEVLTRPFYWDKTAHGIFDG